MNQNYFVHPSAIVDASAKIGAGVKIWHFSHLMKCQLGDSCNIGQGVFIADDVVLGRNVKVQNNVSIYSGVVCQDDVFLGPSMVFTNIKNPRSAIVRKDHYLKTLVRKGATIGANATVVCGVVIGEYALIGAGAVVTKDILPYALVIGNPANQVGWVSEYGHKLEFRKEDSFKEIATCLESGQKYLLENNQVVKI
jgi:UDP-2-acetamido-3-amino-2,3-dideoxy-glucuronate N-acetyltransferase